MSARVAPKNAEEQDHRVLAMQNQVLALVASRSHCQDVFESLCLLIEHESPGASCSILVVDRDQRRLRKGAGPSVSPDYLALLDGLPIAPDAGSCGAAAYSKEIVVCSDVTRDPRWAAFQEAAARFNIRSCWSTPFFSSTGNVLGTFAIAHDHPCTPSEFQLQLLKSASFLAGIARESQLLDTELINKQRLESIGVLAGGVAHDFNNLLVSIMGNIDLARSRPTLDAETAELLASATAASHRARDVTQQLLTFAGGGAPVTTAGSVAEVVTETAEFTLSGSNIDCKYAFEPGLADAELDKGQISQVVQNVILNAMQSMPTGGTIAVDGRQVRLDSANGHDSGSSDAFVQVAVTDHGVGIPADHLERVFDPYFSTKDAGRGLGLSTSYSIMKRHGGRIEVESTLGEGTTVYLYLPVAKRAEAACRCDAGDRWRLQTHACS